MNLGNYRLLLAEKRAQKAKALKETQDAITAQVELAVAAVAKIGMYRVLCPDIWVDPTLEFAAETALVTKLGQGALLNTVEIARCENMGRVRARINMPVHGWVSLASLEDGEVFVEFRDPNIWEAGLSANSSSLRQVRDPNRIGLQGPVGVGCTSCLETNSGMPGFFAGCSVVEVLGVHRSARPGIVNIRLTDPHDGAKPTVPGPVDKAAEYIECVRSREDLESEDEDRSPVGGYDDVSL